VRFLPIFGALLTFALLPLVNTAAGKSKKSSTPAAGTTDHITAVHLASIAISVYATHAAKEYKVTPATKITVNGQPSQLDGLATGMSVVVTSAADGVTAATIDAKTPKR
jgi:NADH:ubiquinone oxidoreductase subunit 5 (subunit L)/multisubunit Na+/H+ antiporter MnhA subunit